MQFWRLAAWRSGNGVGRINEVTLRRARLVLGWVTYGFDSRRRHFISVCNQPTRSTQPFIISRSINWVVSCNRMCFLARAAPSGESLRNEGLVWLIGAVVCLLAACRGSNCTLNAMNGRNLRCSTIGSCQSTATSYGWTRHYRWK